MRSEYIIKKKLDVVLALLMPQNQLILRLLLATGLRVSDAVELRSAQIAPRMTVTERKTKKQRRVSVPPQLCDQIRRQAGEVWAFPGRQPGTHKTRQAVWKDIKRAAKACRLEQQCSPHSARKVYAVNLMRKYGDIERVKKALMHDSAAVTMLYAMADKLV